MNTQRGEQLLLPGPQQDPLSSSIPQQQQPAQYPAPILETYASWVGTTVGTTGQIITALMPIMILMIFMGLMAQMIKSMRK